MKIKSLRACKVVYRGVEYVFPPGVPVEVPYDLALRLLNHPRHEFVKVEG